MFVETISKIQASSIRYSAKKGKTLVKQLAKMLVEDALQKALCTCIGIAATRFMYRGKVRFCKGKGWLV